MKKPKTVEEWEKWKLEQEIWNAQMQEQHEARVADYKRMTRQWLTLAIVFGLEVVALVAVLVFDL